MLQIPVYFEFLLFGTHPLHSKMNFEKICNDSNNLTQGELGWNDADVLTLPYIPLMLSEMMQVLDLRSHPLTPLKLSWRSGTGYLPHRCCLGKPADKKAPVQVINYCISLARNHCWGEICYHLLCNQMMTTIKLLRKADVWVAVVAHYGTILWLNYIWWNMVCFLWWKKQLTGHLLQESVHYEQYSKLFHRNFISAIRKQRLIPR